VLAEPRLRLKRVFSSAAAWYGSVFALAGLRSLVQAGTLEESKQSVFNGRFEPKCLMLFFVVLCRCRRNQLECCTRVLLVALQSLVVQSCFALVFCKYLVLIIFCNDCR